MLCKDIILVFLCVDLVFLPAVNGFLLPWIAHEAQLQPLFLKQEQRITVALAASLDDEDNGNGLSSSDHSGSFNHGGDVFFRKNMNLQSDSTDRMLNPSTLNFAATGRQYNMHDDEGKFVEAKVDRMLQRKIDLWSPDEIFEIMPILMKGDHLEWSINQRIEQYKGEVKELRRLEHSLTFLASLKYSEQQRLARQWIEGILETATVSTEAMDEKIFELIQYENQVMVSPVLEALGLMLRRLQEMSPDEKTLTQFVVETLQKRIEAELKTQEVPFIRLLALLLRLKSREERERMLRMELRNSRLIEEFGAFLEEGSDYIARLRIGPYNLPDDTPEQMQEILSILREFSGFSSPPPTGLHNIHHTPDSGSSATEE